MKTPSKAFSKVYDTYVQHINPVFKHMETNGCQAIPGLIP